EKIEKILIKRIHTGGEMTWGGEIRITTTHLFMFQNIKSIPVLTEESAERGGRFSVVLWTKDKTFITYKLAELMANVLHEYEMGIEKTERTVIEKFEYSDPWYKDLLF